MDIIDKGLKMFRSKKALALMAVGLLLLGSPFLLGILNPGFEGAKCTFFGSYFPSGSWASYSGTDQLHRYQDAEATLISKSQQLAWVTATNTISWTSLATPNDAGLGWQYKEQGLTTITKDKPDLKIHTESSIQLEDITRQGDPLHWNDSAPMDGRRIEYWSKTAVKVNERNDPATNQTIITYQYELTKESFILAPAEFWVGFYLVPSQANAGGTGSGWREGEWQGIVMWFRLDFNVWDNAYKDSWLDDPKQNVFTSTYDGQILNQQKLSDYRGGFPITGWIQGWDKAGWTSTMSEQEGPVWATRRGKNGDAYYTADQLGTLKNALMAKCSFSPGMVGQFLSLYNSPDVNFQYKSDMTAGDLSNNGALASDVKTPDSTMKKIMFFPINIENFGSLADGDWWNGWNVYYPEAYFRVRMIYGVYGTFTYLWTEEVTKPWDQGGLTFPEQVETQGTTIITTTGAGAWTTGITDFFGSPTGLLWTFFVIMVIAIVVVSAFNPGLWTALFMSRQKGGRRKGG